MMAAKLVDTIVVATSALVLFCQCVAAEFTEAPGGNRFVGVCR